MLQVILKSPVPIYEQLIDGIASMIRQGELKSGDSLPPIRQLSKQLEVSVNTVARAYMELERMGLTESNGRKGSYVRETDPLPDNVPQGVFKDNILALVRSGLEPEEIIAIFNQNINEIFN